MNFFEHQHRARRNTWKLIVLFTIAVAIIIILTSLLIGVVLWGTQIWIPRSTSANALPPGFFDQFNLKLLLQVAAATIAVIALVVYLKYQALKDGVEVIAQQLGGKRLTADGANFQQKRLLNVVEEMAIASGMPVPTVYLLPDTSINAFAAGLKHDDAIIGVTRGTIERLDRDQLQGVIAHEFSHILHGDSRINVNLLVVLAGIVFLSTAGRVILDSTHRVGLQYSRSKTGLPVLILGGGLLVLGYIGQFFGNLIKSAVSRQREYLADASAVQYTRNPSGISDALKIIKGSGAGSVLMSAHASECSHLFFEDAVGQPFYSLFTTHPPIEKRIRRIEPNWDGGFLKGKPVTETEKPQTKTRKQAQKQLDKLQSSLAGTGVLDPIMITVADELLQSIPAELYQSTQQIGSAVALMYALRLEHHQQQHQLKNLSADNSLIQQILNIHKELQNLDESYVLPLVELSIPTLKSLSVDQYQSMKKNLLLLIAADSSTDYKEWLHYRLLCHYLDSYFQIQKQSFKRSYHAWYQVKEEAVNLLSLLAWFGSEDHEEAKRCYALATSALGIQETNLTPKDELTLDRINNSLEKLDYLVPMLKEQFVKACATSILHDERVTFMEWDLLRVTSACIGCPMPIIYRPEI